ncbi:TauD/TfdA family dioxygenase [Allokutzneria sp. NRRL B-24872]|uniref:TauD/TfdA family dioxygenase n=1 Tax=Allokutzneria sp. NRRL B-24872 TaxID=1137961 RepID=UPI00143D9FB8
MRSGFAGFSACALNPHTDRSDVPRPPALLMMMSCTRAAPVGGECVLVDGQAVCGDLAQLTPEVERWIDAVCPASCGSAQVRSRTWFKSC